MNKDNYTTTRQAIARRILASPLGTLVDESLWRFLDVTFHKAGISCSLEVDSIRFCLRRMKGGSAMNHRKSADDSGKRAEAARNLPKLPSDGLEAWVPTDSLPPFRRSESETTALYIDE